MNLHETEKVLEESLVKELIERFNLEEDDYRLAEISLIAHEASPVAALVSDVKSPAVMAKSIVDALVRERDRNLIRYSECSTFTHYLLEAVKEFRREFIEEKEKKIADNFKMMIDNIVYNDKKAVAATFKYYSSMMRDVYETIIYRREVFEKHMASNIEMDIDPLPSDLIDLYCEGKSWFIERHNGPGRAKAFHNK